MNKLNIIALTALSFTSVVLAQHTIRIGDGNLTAAFEDGSLSETNRAIICADITRYFSYSGDLGRIFSTSSYSNNIPVANLGNCTHNPNIKQYVEIENMISKRIVIPKPLSDIYTNILVSVPASTSLLQSAWSFVGTLNDGSVSNRSDAAMQRLFRSSELVPEKDPPEMIRESVIEMWGARRYVLPTIIDFLMADLSPNNPPVPSYALITTASVVNGHLNAEQYTIAFDGTEWFIVEL